ncbi:TRAP transporter substrate-binding protein [Lysinibacillus yapensis]|uniref:TRAP transporter substrate-binding protein n=1 Tax=Ureibacillus yapensis TaxID=2304605 RepID=A0A396SGL7_9BACL|nr:TRAP transporter substrate-binding protein [Lysinibacillus yapensis]RHW37616.1 TRAP transporter substrate-binding protein [Lysinibacillus yapensis]
MKGRKVKGLFTTMLLAAGILAACSQEEAAPATEAEGTTPAEEPKITLRLADNQPADYPTVIGDQKFAELVSERTDGRITIEVFPSGQLGDEKSVLEQIQLGAIDFARTNSSPLAEFHDELKVFSIPYLFNSDEHLWNFLNSETGTTLLDGLQEAKMQGLAYYDSGSRNFYSTKPLTTMEELKGQKIRVQQSEVNIQLMEALGASATPMPYGEVFSALQTGIIDGAENNLPSIDSSNHYQEAKYLIMDHHTRVPEVLLASKASWDKLSAEDQEIIRQAALDSVETQRQAWAEYEEKSLKTITEAGVTITEVEDITPWKEAVKPIVDNFTTEYPEIADAINSANP